MKLRLQERSRPRSTLLINVALVIVSSLLLFALYQRHAAKPTTATVFQVRVPFNAGPQHVPQQPSLPLISSPELSSPPEAEADTWPLEALHPSEWTFKGVQLPKIAEGDMDLVPVCNSTFYKQHPFNIEDYERSYTPGATCSMPADLLYKIKTGKPVLITVVGGSMTQGRRCTDGKRGWTHCAWSSRLDDRLKEAFPNSNVTVNNIAMPGFSYGHWLKNGMMDGMAHADVVIIDEQVNSHVSGPARHCFSPFYHTVIHR